MNNLFNKRAFQKRHQNGDRTGPITLLTPPLKSTLGLGVLIALGGSLWAIFARIPLNVQGTGILLPVSTINSSFSRAEGIAYWMFDRDIEPWHESAKQFIDRSEQFSDRDVAELAQNIILAAKKNPSRNNQTESSAQVFSELLNEDYDDQFRKRGRLLMWVHSNGQHEKLSSTFDQMNRTLRDIASQDKNIRAKQNILRQEAERRSAHLSEMKALEVKGYVTKTSVLQQEAHVDQLLSEMLSNQNELIQLQDKRNQSYQKLREELAEIIQEQMIFADRDIYISQVVPNDGQSVNKGDVLLRLSDDVVDEPEMVPLFLSNNEMAEVFPGMPALATPSGFKRSEVGGIRGRIKSVATLPSGIDEVVARVSVKSLAQMISRKEQTPTLAVLALERAGADSTPNSGGYVWSSKVNLPFPPTPGDRLDVEVTIRKVAPIELVIPAFRRWLGLSSPMAREDSPAAVSGKISE